MLTPTGSSVSDYSGSSAERRLAAVAVADIVGYTILMGRDEARTHNRWMALRQIVIGPGALRHHGRVVKSTGDGVLAEFPSVFNALEWAREVQQAVFRIGLEEDPELPPIMLRMAVHIGEVIVTADDIYGDGVNLVSRLQEYAEPSGILLSETAYAFVRNAIGELARDLGFLHLKHVDRPVRAYALSGPGSSKPRLRHLRRSRPSIAVLPFIEHGVPREQSYFGDGIVEDIIGVLASVQDLFVISRHSTLKYRQRPTDLAVIGNELGVRYVLSGSVWRTGDRIRISAELADAETSGVMWSDRVNGHISDLFAAQDALTERILQTISPNIFGAEMQRVARTRTENLDAYDYMLRGLDLVYRLTPDQSGQAYRMLQKSIELDASYATPYALTALWHSIRLNQGWSSDHRQDLAAVDRFTRAALEHDPLNVWALALAGHLRSLLFRDYDGAIISFDRAIAASPNSSFAWARSSPTFCYIGDGAEAQRRAEEAIHLSPFDPQIFFAHTALGHAAYTLGNYEAAAAWGRQAYAENPQYTANIRLLIASLAAAGQLGEAREISGTLVRLEPGFRVRSFCGSYAYREAERRALLAEHLLLAGLPE